MPLSADLEDPEGADEKIGDDPEGHVVNVQSAVAAADVVERALARLDRVGYRPRDRESGEERPGAEELALPAMGSEMVVIGMPKVIGVRRLGAWEAHLCQWARGWRIVPLPPGR